MDMKKKLLLSMILLALCLIQASADTYYFKIQLTNEKGEPEALSDYITVSYDNQNKVYVNGLRDLIKGNTVTDEKGVNYTLPKTADNKGDLKRIWGIVFANGKGSGKSEQLNIMNMKRGRIYVNTSNISDCASIYVIHIMMIAISCIWIMLKSWNCLKMV